MKEFKKKNNMTESTCFGIFFDMINIAAPICFLIYMIKDTRQRTEEDFTSGDFWQYIFMRFGAIGTSMFGILLRAEKTYSKLTTKWAALVSLAYFLITNCIAFGLFVYWTV